MKRPFMWLLVLVILFGSIAAPGFAQEQGELIPLNPSPSAETGEMLDETPQLWFIELASPPTADGGDAAATRRDKANFRKEAQTARIQYVERRSFDTLWNGLSVSIAPSQLPKLARLSSVKALYPVITIPMPAVSPMESPEMATALAMTGADIAQSELGLTGTGVRVAVMDTGIDYDHPDLGGCFGPGCRVVTGWDFVGDAFNADPASPAYNPIPVPDPDPDDCNGHGTHVAGIVGASAVSSTGVTGVAPGVTFGAYRVFGCAGSTTADILIAAMERALEDDMHILNMSLGAAFQWPQYPSAIASDRLVNKGMVVVASIGNSGANGIYSTGAPGVGKKVIGVASFDNSHVALNTFTISPDDTSIGYGPATGSPLPPTWGSLAMERTGTPASAADACSTNPPAPGSLTGKAALIRRGTCTFYEKARNAELAGAAAVILYNNSAGRFSPTVAGSPPITIPVVSISDAEGILINNRLAAGPVTMTWTAQAGSFINPTGGLISSFSSYGMAPDLTLKPDIGAPGGLIRSTYPLEAGGYATISGTSMASPHVAGGVALLLEAQPLTPAQAVRGILQNSADPKVWWGNPGLGFLDNVHRQGAGMLDIAGAILESSRIEPSKLSLGESEAGPVVQTLKIENKSSVDVTYDLSHIGALSTGANTFSPSFSFNPAAVTFSTDSLTVPAGGSASVEVTITAPPAPVGGQYGGYLVFTPQGEGQTLRVPYAGYVGDYQARAALTAGGSAFPWIARLSAGSYFKVNGPADWSFSMQGNDIPFVLVHLDHQVRHMRMVVKDAYTGRSYHRAFSDDYLGRNSTSTAFNAYAFDGITTNGNRQNTVPNGVYIIELSVLKALGDSNNPAHWETWTSPAFTIARP
jgi:minor extracellular serine protease Vpr